MLGIEPNRSRADHPHPQPNPTKARFAPPPVVTLTEPIMTTALATNVNARPSLSVRLRRAARALAETVRALANRWLAKDLCDLSDYELADIGLTRADLARAFDLPLASDPSRHLNEVARSSSMRTIPVSSGTVWSRDYPPETRGRVA
jgi:uncharacterized protein YjiS (DUF1127 family)